MIVLINCGSSKFPEFERICQKNSVECISLNWLDLPAQKDPNWNGVVISGAPILLTETDHSIHLRSMGRILSWQIPTLGVCFGHQIMGIHFGAGIMRCEEDRDFREIEFHKHSPLLHQLEKNSMMREDHCECISLPNDFELLASSSICEVEGIQHSSLPLYGVQFHPEVSGSPGEQLLNNFFNICTE